MFRTLIAFCVVLFRLVPALKRGQKFVFFFEGPPGSGKDTACWWLYKVVSRFVPSAIDAMGDYCRKMAATWADVSGGGLAPSEAIVSRGEQYLEGNATSNTRVQFLIGWCRDTGQADAFLAKAKQLGYTTIFFWFDTKVSVCRWRMKRRAQTAVKSGATLRGDEDKTEKRIRTFVDATLPVRAHTHQLERRGQIDWHVRVDNSPWTKFQTRLFVTRAATRAVRCLFENEHEPVEVSETAEDQQVPAES